MEWEFVVGAIVLYFVFLRPFKREFWDDEVSREFFWGISSKKPNRQTKPFVPSENSEETFQGEEDPVSAAYLKGYNDGQKRGDSEGYLRGYSTGRARGRWRYDRW